jgi:hypothetical protein
MIISQETSSPVISNIVATPSRFKIKASAKAFKILSGFYSEPILAIPRELGANAWDSHVKANNTDKMFEVHAPNTLEPWFSVRDFGTGLSPEHVDTIYTTYFESTKTGDNDSDGCMGLGSKTPFNYTDNFNVTSYFNNKKYVYNCFIDEQGSPNIMQVTVEDTSEHNGLEIKIGVKIADIGMWVDKITRAYEPFRHRPTIKGANITYKPREYIYEGKHWAMRNNDGHYNRGCNAFMGNYCYPINVNSLRRELYNVPNSDGYKLEQALTTGNFDFFFEIGELEVAPNKEQLQYGENNPTTLAIITAVQTAICELKDLVYKNIESPKTRWEAMYLYNKYNGYGSQYAHIRNIIGDIHIKLGKDSIISASEGVNTVHSKTGIHALYSDTTSAPVYHMFNIDGPSARFRRTDSYSPYSDTKKVVFFYTNLPSIKSARLRYHLRTKYATNFPTVVVIMDVSKNCDTFLKHKAYFGWDSADVVEIESLPKPPSVPRQNKTVGTNEIWYASISEFVTPTKSRGNSHRAYINWLRKSETIDSKNTYYYVDFYYTDARWKEKTVTEHVAKVVKILVANKLITGTDTIYGINVKNQNLLKVGKWVNIFELAKKQTILDREKIEQDLYVREQRVCFEPLANIHAKLIRNPSIVSQIKNSDTRNMFQTFMKSFSLVSQENNEDTSLYLLFDFKAKKHSELEFNPSTFKNLLDGKYMGIFDLGSGYYGESIGPIYKLINFVDEKS